MGEFDEGRGFVLLFRKIDNWGWYKDSNTFHLFCHILLHVNYKQKEWKGIKVPAGSMITSVANLSAQTGMSIRNVRTALDHLKTSGEITIQTTKTYTLIKVAKWREYQGEPTNKLTKNRQRDDKEPTKSRQQLNNGNNDNNNIYIYTRTRAREGSDYSKLMN